MAEVGEMRLRYHFCAAQIDFVVGGVSFIHEYLPLIDFALQMRWLVTRLPLGEETTVDFTENAEIIRFTVEGDLVRVHASWGELAASAPLVEMVEALDVFLPKAYATLVAEVPGLEDNPTVQQIMATP
ncbi:hypothetical protein [Actinokineospora diospyrosa]|uniref:Uncharacterized protein n=1 Tax=Actinokineospora diospyrosa TaxID=103728 RepID=A0ABT1IF77_9PSEU|nr:hypothetical protein [Actinokineospora diospyrosa]MCP2271299.1 hypothetical protein [Actinokineospora diospyrosa]